VEATKDEPSGKLQLDSMTHHCPCNYNGSAKSMEASRVVSMMTALYDEGGKYLSILVSDNDSTTRSHSQHLYKAVMDFNGWMNKADHWPKMKGNKYVADNGKLPLQIKAIDKYLADPSHCGKSFGCAMYKLKKEAGSSSSQHLTASTSRGTTTFGSGKTKDPLMIFLKRDIMW